MIWFALVKKEDTYFKSLSSRASAKGQKQETGHSTTGELKTKKKSQFCLLTIKDYHVYILIKLFRGGDWTLSLK